MRRKKRAVSSLNSGDNEQILKKVVWQSNKYGTNIGRNEVFEKGVDLVRPAMLSEVVPEKEAYFIRPNGEGNEYFLLHQGFSRKAEYEDIKNFVKHKMVYVYKNFNVYGK